MPSRPNVLAYASPTTSRFLVFLAALLTAGAFVGTWLHNEVVGDEWTKTVVRCIGSASADPDAQGALARNAAEERCRAAAERRRSAYSFAGAGGVLVLGVCVALLAPGVLERRRRLRRAGPRLADAERRVAELAHEVGLRRPPIVMVTPASRSDAFAYGFPGSYRIALPPAVAVRWRDTTLFDPLVRHELAHVEHRDVALAWLARSVWYVIAPLLALPIVVGALESDLSLLPDYLWRAALLALTVQLVSAALLRSREHDADLRAAQAGGSVEAVAGVLDRLPDHSARWRALARHPRPASRKAVLERPQLTARVTFVDGVTAAFLAALSIPLIVTAITSLLIGSGHLERAQVVAAVIAGPLIGGSVGLGLCRAALVQRVAGGHAASAPAALGVALGLVLGHAASLGHTGVGVAALEPPLWLPLIALLGAGATVLVAGVGELLADAAPMFRNGRAASLAALIVTSLIYAAALWVAITAEMPLTAGLTKVWLVVTLSSWLVLAAAAAIAAACALGLWAADRPRDVPGWVAERGLPRPWPSGEPGRLARALANGLACGAVGVLALLALRLIAGPAPDLAAREGRFYLFVWMTAAATSVALLALAAGQRRLGTGMGAAVVACLTTIAGFLVMNTALGGALDARFAAGVARPAIALAFVATVVLAPLALVPRRAFNGFAATAVAIACAGSLVLARDAITPGPVDANVPEEIGHPVAVQVYVTAFAPALLNDYVAIQREAPQLATDLAGVTQVADRFQALLARAEAYDARADEVRAVHRDCIAALRAGVRIYAEIEAALRSGDQGAFDRAAAAQAEEQRAWSRWQAGLAALASGA